MSQNAVFLKLLTSSKIQTSLALLHQSIAKKAVINTSTVIIMIDKSPAPRAPRAPPAPPAPPVKLMNGVNSGNLATVAHGQGPARVNKAKSHMTSFVLFFLRFLLLLPTNATANNGMINTAGGHQENFLQQDISHDAPNMFIAETTGSLNGIVTRTSYLRTHKIEPNLGINVSPKNIDHTNINNANSNIARGQTAKSDSDALTSKEKKIFADVKEKENTKGEHRDLVSYKSVTIRCRHSNSIMTMK